MNLINQLNPSNQTVPQKTEQMTPTEQMLEMEQATPTNQMIQTDLTKQMNKTDLLNEAEQMSQVMKQNITHQTSQAERAVPSLDLDQIDHQILLIQMKHDLRSIPGNSVNIKINPILSRLVQPLNEREQEVLFDKLSSFDTVPVIHIWRNCHLADQYVYELCTDYSIPYRIVELSFENINQAALYICSIQLSNENLTPEYKMYIIGQKLEYILQGSYLGIEANSKYNLAAKMGHKLFLSAGTIVKYHTISNALNTVFEQDENFARNILLGKVRISHENIPELARLMPDEIKAVAAAAKRDNLGRMTLSFIRNEAQWSHVKNRAPQSRRERTEEKMVKHATIRQMPQYDPDSEANSLCMTIDSWISSIQRVHSSSNFGKITTKASLQLMKKLSFLEHTVKTVQESLVERGTA